MVTESGNKILYLLKTRGPLTAKDLAELMAMTSMGARQHLQQLQGSGLVDTFDRKEKVGRPSRFWQLTETGHQRFPDRHSDLTLNLIDNVCEVFGEEGLNSLIEKRQMQMQKLYQSELDALTSIEAKLNRLAELRSKEGYMAEVVETETPEQWLLVENHCPICAAAERCQNFCRSELEIFRSCLPTAEVKRQDYLLDGARRCAYLVSAVS